MRTIIKPGSVELKTIAQLETFLSADDNCLLGKFCCFYLTMLMLSLSYLTRTLWQQ